MRQVQFSRAQRDWLASTARVYDAAANINTVGLVCALPSTIYFDRLPDKKSPVECFSADQFQLEEMMKVVDALRLPRRPIPDVKIYNWCDGDDATRGNIHADLIAYLYPFMWRPTRFSALNHFLDIALPGKPDKNCPFMQQSPRSFYERYWWRGARKSGAKIIFNIFGSNTLQTPVIAKPPYRRTHLGTLELKMPKLYEADRKMDVLVHEGWMPGQRLIKPPIRGRF